MRPIKKSVPLTSHSLLCKYHHHFSETWLSPLNSNPCSKLPPQVEGEAQGSEDGIQALLKYLDRGPTHAHVVKLEKQEIDLVGGEEGFEVRR